MRLSGEEASARLRAADHGVLCTRNAARGVDAVPVTFAVDAEGFVGIPVDRVKPKRAVVLQRERNLARDPRATLLVEHWDPHDWTRLWWVRAELRWVPQPDPARPEALAGLLAERYPQYRDRPFERVLVLRVVALSGWSAAGD